MTRMAADTDRRCEAVCAIPVLAAGRSAHPSVTSSTMAKRGIATPKQELDLVRRRIAAAERHCRHTQSGD